jgi:hypothetical protein
VASNGRLIGYNELERAGSGRFLIRGSVSEFAWRGGILREISGQLISQLIFEPAT